MLADGAVAWLDVPARARDRASARRRAASPRVRSRRRWSNSYSRRQAAYSPGARPQSMRRGRFLKSSSASWSGSATDLRYLVISDIHANLEALDAVLTAAGRYDHALVLGDLVGYGADPNAVIDRVRALLAATFIRGNHDKVGAGLENTDGFNYLARQPSRGRASTLTPDHRSGWLRCRKARSSSTDLVEICHGAPFDEDAVHLRRPRRDARASRGRGGPLCLFGHTHVPAAFRTEPKCGPSAPLHAAHA